MDLIARQFARKVLLVHGLLLLLVALLVLGAARQVYKATRKQMIDEAEMRQKLLARQTARSIEDFYTGIFDNIDLIREEAEVSGSTTRPMTAVGPGISNVLWLQLRDRVSHLASFDRSDRFDNLPPRTAQEERTGQDARNSQDGRTFQEGRNGSPPNRNNPSGRASGERASGEREAGERGSQDERSARSGGRLQELTDRFRRFRQLGPEMLGEPTDQSISILDIATATRAVLKDRADAEPFVSGLLHLGSKKEAVTLVVIPPAERRFPRVIVAVVPVEKVEERFVEARKGREEVSAVLVDEALNTVAASNQSFIGHNIARLNAEAGKFARLAETFGKSGTQVSDSDPRRPGAISTWEPVQLRGSRWTLAVNSPLTDVNAIVGELFGKALFWTIFVIIAFAGILTSTAVFMIRNRIRLENQRTALITKQLSDARAIQLAWLPGHAMTAADLEIAATNQPAQHISGDFYNWFEIDDRGAASPHGSASQRMVVLIGDVTGHGMSAAFLMATTQLLVRTTFPRTNDPGRCLEEVNRQLCVQAFNGQFVTMLLMVIDTGTNQIELAVAGHPPPLISNGSGFEPMRIEPQLVLGVDRDATFTTERVALGEGASIVLYTDGVQDAFAPNGERFGNDRLLDAVSRSKSESAQALLQAVVSAVNEHRAGEPLGDDLTLVTLQLQPETAGVAAGV